ncbi:MAG: hypothetical protein LLG37_10290 [Spirochaetia bacterium]|nr:hypothetical protein [Spirochaetia bacterium]
MVKYFNPKKAKEKQKLTSAKQVNLKEFSSALAIMPYNIEEFILATPAVAALKDAMPPEAKITAIVSEEARKLAMGCRFIDNVMVFKTVNPVQCFKTLMSIGRSKFELMINFNPDITTAFVVNAFCGARAKIAYAVKQENGIYNAMHNLKLHTIDHPQHKIVKYLNLVRFIGANSYDFTPKIRIPDAESDWAREFFRKHNIKSSDTIIGVHPCLKNPKKRWAINKWDSLTESLVDKHGCKVLAFYHKDEKDRAHEYNVVTKKRAIMVDTHDYIRMAALARFMTCFVCNETDFMHIFSPFTHVVAIWGDGDPEENKPVGRDNDVVTAADGNADSIPVSRVSEIVVNRIEHGSHRT